MDAGSNPSNPDAITINLDSLVGKLQINLQHLSDLVLFSNAVIPSAQQSTYDSASAFFQFQPAQNQRLDFNSAKERFSQWCLANSFKDAVNFLNCFLDECYMVCEMLKARQGHGIQRKLFQWILGEGRSRFHQKGLPDKISKLKATYNVFSGMEENVLSLNRVRNCLVHRVGFVGLEDVNSVNVLSAKYKQLQLLVINPNDQSETIISGPTRVEAGGQVGVRFNDFNKEFSLGDRISFSEHEHIWAIFTFFWFGQEIKNSICKNFNIENKIVPGERGTG